MTARIILLLGQADREVNAFYLADKLRSLGHEVSNFPATNARNADFREIFLAEDAGLTAGEAACAWSHIRLWREIRDSGEPCLVFEDDAWLQGDLPESGYEEIPHLLSFSQWDRNDPHNSFQVYEENDFWSRTAGLPYGTQGYYLTPEGAERLLDFATPVCDPSDVILSKASLAGVIETHLLKTPPATQSPAIASVIGAR